MPNPQQFWCSSPATQIAPNQDDAVLLRDMHLPACDKSDAFQEVTEMTQPVVMVLQDTM
jgi:hypothetical protein